MSEKKVRAVSVWEGKILRTALVDSLVKLDPLAMARNPVMFVVEVGSVLTTILLVRDLFAATRMAPLWFTLLVHEWTTAATALRQDDLPRAMAALRRSLPELESLNASWKPIANRVRSSSLGKVTTSSIRECFWTAAAACRVCATKRRGRSRSS